MSIVRTQRWLASLVGVALTLSGLACGTSTTDRLASALPPTAEAGAQNTHGAEPTEPATEAGPPPTRAATRTPRPTDPPPTPTESAQELKLLAQGFGQDDRELGYGFKVENPNAGLAVVRSQFQIAAYDAAGVVLETDSGYIDVLLPGQTSGIGGTMILDEGAKVDKIEVQLSDGDVEATQVVQTFTVEQATFTEGQFIDQVRGIVTNPFSKDATQLRVSGIVLDSSGAIIGGGYTYLNFVLAGQSTGVELSAAKDGDVASVEVYSLWSGLSLLSSDDGLPGDADEPSIAKQGFGQDDYQIGYGALIVNGNADYSIERSQFHVNFFAEDGALVGTEEGYIDVLLPGQTLGLAGSTLVDDGIVVARAEVQLKAGDYEKTDPLPGFTAENVNYIPDRFSAKVTGQVVSPYTKDITYLRVMAIAYNEAGDIIGGGFTYLDFVPAGGKAAAEVSVVTSGIPATVELYGTVSALSDLK